MPWKLTKRNQCHGKNCLQDFCLTNVSSYWWKEKLEEIKKCIIILLSLDHCTVWDFWTYDALRENVGNCKVGIGRVIILNLVPILCDSYFTLIEDYPWKFQNSKSKSHRLDF